MIVELKQLIIKMIYHLEIMIVLNQGSANCASY